MSAWRPHGPIWCPVTRAISNVVDGSILVMVWVSSLKASDPSSSLDHTASKPDDSVVGIIPVGVAVRSSWLADGGLLIRRMCTPILGLSPTIIVRLSCAASTVAGGWDLMEEWSLSLLARTPMSVGVGVSCLGVSLIGADVRDCVSPRGGVGLRLARLVVGDLPCRSLLFWPPGYLRNPGPLTLVGVCLLLSLVSGVRSRDRLEVVDFALADLSPRSRLLFRLLLQTS